MGADRNAVLPGYRLPTAQGGTVCVPLLLTANRPPPGYQGRDFHVDEFTDARLKARWHSCKADASCFQRIDAQMQRWLPSDRERARRSTGTVDPSVRIDPEGEVDLRRIRRPAFFAKAPYRESIAGAEPRTYTVEFSVPCDTFERIELKMQDSIKLRGWYIEGAGVDDGQGGRLHALVIMANGGGGQMTAMGQRWWRENLQALNAAGFDVLAYDRRGEGISGGVSDIHTLEQGEDVFRVLEQLESGRGLRMLAPSGQLLEGDTAGGRLLAGMKARQIPILLGGYSRGSMSTAWAMTKNFVESCSYDMPVVNCAPPKGYTNIKGAILLASFASGAGYVPAAPDLADRNLLLGGMAAEHHIVFYPNSATLAGMARWPAAFFGKGLWDRAESLEGTIAAYDRIRGLKEIVVARGPHSIETWHRDDQRYLHERMVAFAKAAVTGAPTVPSARPWTDLRSLVATTAERWEASSRPRKAGPTSTR
ncbi:hypothetical protein APY03_5739 [Variovorax sp. WDL1]|nr:hypothetical protein APY03_5739 [Variovorax sp. WDL1]